MGRWLAVPASLNRAVAGTRQHHGKQEKLIDGKPETKKKIKHGCFHAFCLILLGAPFDENLPTSCFGFCMASECGRLFSIGVSLRSAERTCWHQLFLVPGDAIATPRKSWAICMAHS